jgi:DNA-binding transcriptional LysR family regulator
MYMLNLDWNLLKSFASVVKEGSLSGAARVLKSTQPTIGRHIEALELELGMSLFIRSREGLIPTEYALNILPEVLSMTGSYGAFIRKISGENVDDVGTIRLAVSEVMGIEVIPDILVKFHKKYPNLKIELSISNKSVNLLKREADLAIRMSNPTQDALIAKKIGDTYVGLFCHQKYIKTYGVPPTIEALKQFHLIGPDEDQIFIDALKSSRLNIDREDFFYKTDNHIAQLNILRKGLGIGVMQTKLAENERNLVQVLKKEFNYSLPVWVVMHEDLKASKKIRTLFNFLVEEINDYLNKKRKRLK